MLSHFLTLPTPRLYREVFHVEPPRVAKAQMVWPGYPAPFIRLPDALPGVTDQPLREVLPGLFGMVPPWATNTRISQRTYTAAVETVERKPAYHDAWRRWQHCIVPAMALYVLQRQSGRLIPTRLARADGRPMGVAGLWSQWRALHGQPIFSFTMLTVAPASIRQAPESDGPQPRDDRTVVILNEDSYTDWLHAAPQQRLEFMRPFPTERLVATVDTRWEPQSEHGVLSSTF